MHVIIENRTGKDYTTRLVRLFSAISLVPAAFLPIYNQFLHGGRDAASILPRSAIYAEVHILGAMCMFLAGFGLIAIYTSYGNKFGRFGLAAFAIALLAQMMFAGNLLIDGFFNPLLAKFDPALQTDLHSSNFLQTASSQGNYLSSLLGFAYIFDPLTSLLYLLGFAMLGIVILRTRVMPWPIGVLFIGGGAILSAAIMIPQWLESIGYAGIGGAVVWAGLLTLRAGSEV